MAETNMNTQNQTEQETNPQGNAGNQSDQTEPENKQEVTLESLMNENAKLKADAARNKAALDKALKEKGDITKQYREILTESQQAKIDKETADEEHRQYVAELEQFKAKAEAKARYALQGMPEEMAVKAAECEITGDMDGLAMIQKQYTESVIKAKEVEWLKSRPRVNAGTGTEVSVTKEQFDRMNYTKRVELKRKDPELYKKYTSN